MTGQLDKTAAVATRQNAQCEVDDLDLVLSSVNTLDRARARAAATYYWRTGIGLAGADSPSSIRDSPQNAEEDGQITTWWHDGADVAQTATSNAHRFYAFNDYCRSSISTPFGIG